MSHKLVLYRKIELALLNTVFCPSARICNTQYGATMGPVPSWVLHRLYKIHRSQRGGSRRCRTKVYPELFLCLFPQRLYVCNVCQTGRPGALSHTWFNEEGARVVFVDVVTCIRTVGEEQEQGRIERTRSVRLLFFFFFFFCWDTAGSGKVVEQGQLGQMREVCCDGGRWLSMACNVGPAL